MQEFLQQELGLSEETTSAIMERFHAVRQEKEMLQREFDAFRLQTAIHRALSDAGAKNLTAAAALMDPTAVSEENGTYIGIGEQVEKAKKECPYLFRMAEASGIRLKGAANTDQFTEYARRGARI